MAQPTTKQARSASDPIRVVRHEPIASVSLHGGDDALVMVDAFAAIGRAEANGEYEYGHGARTYSFDHPRGRVTVMVSTSL